MPASVVKGMNDEGGKRQRIGKRSTHYSDQARVGGGISIPRASLSPIDCVLHVVALVLISLRQTRTVTHLTKARFIRDTRAHVEQRWSKFPQIKQEFLQEVETVLARKLSASGSLRQLEASPQSRSTMISLLWPLRGVFRRGCRGRIDPIDKFIAEKA